MAEQTPRHLATDEGGQTLRVQRVPLGRRVPVTMVRLLRTWSGRAVFAAGLVWLPLGIAALQSGAEQGLLFGVSLAVVAFGLFLLVLCGWRRYDDPGKDPRRPGEWGYWDWRPDAGIVAGTCLVAVGLGGLLGSLI